ncbi:MAG: TetR/AcrR family transcriptional regulator, partial [Flavobacteriaceae bacterium]|nr:TetR/AcrR family transcriptional regulator [Flavobacteriaceae bacterium]
MDGARMQEIADEAGINKALLHYYYRSKQLLFEAVFKAAFLSLIPQLSKILDNDLPLEEKIRTFAANYIQFVAEHPYLPNFIIQEINKNPQFIRKILDNKDFPSIEKFKAQVKMEIEKGTIKAIKAEQLFINLMALNVFPFIAAPLIKGVLKMDDKTFKQMMEDRKTEVGDFIINSIKK